MIKFKQLKKITVITLLFFGWFSLMTDFNFASEVTENDLEKAVKKYYEEKYTDSLNLLENFTVKFENRSDLRKKVAEAYYWIARIYFKFDKIDKVDENLEKIFNFDPGFDKGEPDESFKKRIARIKQEVADSFYLKAKKFYNEKDYTSVKEYLRKVFRMYTDYCKEGEDAGFAKRVEKIRKEFTNVIPKECKRKKNNKVLIWVAIGVVVVVALIFLLKKKKPKKYTLKVERGEGVEGPPASGTYEYEEGLTVNYDYRPQSGYTDLTVTLDGNVVASSGTIKMDRNHELKAVTTELGSINVTSVPTGARIYLDGTDTGRETNAVISNVTPGTHTIRLTLAGYDTEERTVQVEAGQEARVDIPLTRSYTNVITINGKLGTKPSGQDDNNGQDAYQFYVAENCNLIIQFNSERHIIPEFALFSIANTDPGNVLVGGSGRGESIKYTVTTSGKYYYVAIEDETPDKDEKAGTYTITITSNKHSLGDYKQIIDEGPETL